MSNMSYCRFENTARDLSYCQDALDALFSADLDSVLSSTELAAAKQLVKTCLAIADMVRDAGDPAIEETDDLAKHVAGILDAANEKAEDEQASYDAQDHEVRGHG
jgi:hypothetical protein